MPRKNMKKYEREQQIKRLFSLVGEGELTAYEVAKVLDVTPAKWLYDLLNKLVEDGALEYREVTHRSNSMKKVYRPLPPVDASPVVRRRGYNSAAALDEFLVENPGFAGKINPVVLNRKEGNEVE